MKVLFVTNLPSPYRINFFLELSKYCNLTVFFEGKRSKTLTYNWNDVSLLPFKQKFFSEIFYENKIIVSLIIKVLFGKFDQIVICTYNTRTQSILIVLLKIFSISYHFETDGGIIPLKESKIKFFIKKKLISGANGYFSSCMECDRYLVHYGAKKELISRYPFTSLFESDIVNKIPTLDEKLNFKKVLGIPYKTIIIGVGQFIYRKGFDVLLESCAYLPKNIGVYLIGGNPTKDYLEIQKRLGLKNVKYITFLSKEELDQWFLAADIFVLPTREDVWGLVINEAMSKGLPVITTKNCLAGLELLSNKECLCPINDSLCLAEKINNLINDKDYSKKISENNLITIKNFTFEKMALKHIERFKNR